MVFSLQICPPKLGLHEAICLTDSVVFKLGHCVYLRDQIRMTKFDYNIPGACLLHRSPSPSYGSEKQQIRLVTSNVRNLSQAEKIVSQEFKQCAQYDETPVKSTLLSRDNKILSRDMSFMSLRSNIML